MQINNTKYGMRIPTSITEAYEIDKENGNTLWREAINREMENVSVESFQIQMGFPFPFLRANDLRTSLLIVRTLSLSYVCLFLNLIANAVNNNDQHVRSGTNVRMSQNPHRRRKRMGTGIIIARRTTITLWPGQGRAAQQLHRGYIRIVRTPTPTRTLTRTFHIGF